MMGGFGSGPQQKTTKRRGSILRAPASLPDKVKPYFKRIAKQLADHGTAPADTDLIAQFAAALWLADQALEKMATDGILETDQAHGDGTEKRKHPAYTIWRNAVSVASSIGAQFGATIASRARLGLDQNDDGEQSLAELLFEHVAQDANERR